MCQRGKMTLREKQSKFTHMVGLLIIYAYQQGYEITFGHAFRCDECPVGLKASYHKQKLAIDLNLFKHGQYLTTTEDHKPLGLYWEFLGGTWGGRFDEEDGNHYSFMEGYE